MDADGSSILTGALAVLGISVIRGFFTVCETSLTEIGDNKAKSFSESTDRREKRVYSMLNRPLRLMTAFSALRIATAAIISFVLSLFIYAPLSRVFMRLFGVRENIAVFGCEALSAVLLILAAVILLTVFTDGIPRRIVAFGADPEKLSLRCSWAADAVISAVTPLTMLCSRLITRIAALFGIDASLEKELVTEEDILMMIDAGNETGVIEDSEQEMINNVFEFGDLPVSDVMTHRTDITAAAVDSKLPDLVYTAINSGFSRIPVYKESIDHIIGMICVKDLLCLVGNDSVDCFAVKDFVRDTIYVPETSLCGDLFKRMTAAKTQLAVAVDEYGGTAGIVTMEDLVETIVGNIQDEFDNETADITELSDGTYSISGTSDPSDIMKQLGQPLPEDTEFDTMSGFMISLLGHIPEENDEITSTVYKNIRLTALIVEDMRITRIKAEILPGTDEKETENKPDEK